MPTPISKLDAALVLRFGQPPTTQRTWYYKPTRCTTVGCVKSTSGNSILTPKTFVAFRSIARNRKTSTTSPRMLLQINRAAYQRGQLILDAWQGTKSSEINCHVSELNAATRRWLVQSVGRHWDTENLGWALEKDHTRGVITFLIEDGSEVQLEKQQLTPADWEEVKNRINRWRK